MRFEKKYKILFVVTPLIVVLDQVTKIWAKANLRPLTAQMHPQDRYISVIDGFFRLKYAENTGAAWGLGSGWSPQFRVVFFILVSLAAVVFIIWMFRKLRPDQKLLAFAISFVLAGAIGNLIDRFYMNKVVDFIDWFIKFDSPMDLWLFTIRAGEHHWPTFNIADVGISVGVVLLALDMIFGKGSSASTASSSREGTDED